MNYPKGLVKGVAIAVGALVFILWFFPFAIIGPGERGVVVRLGAVQDRILGEGIHFIMPFAERVVKIDVQTHKIEISAMSFSKDLQTVDTVIALNYRLEPTQVQRLWQEIGQDYQERVINPVIQESVKAATAKFTAAELVAERPRVRDEIKQVLLDRLVPRHVVVDDFSIVNFDFSDSYEKAIEEKQIAEQQALKAQNDLKRVQVEAEQRVAQARAEAEAIKIQSEALRENQYLIRLEAVKKWNGVLPNYVLGNSVPFIELGETSGKQQ